jgi:hypothetical protein
VPKSHFRHLHKNLHPPGSVRVWATVHGPVEGSDEFQVAGVQSRGLLITGVRRRTETSGYALTVNVGHIAFQIFGHESREHLHVNPPPIQGVDSASYEIAIWPTQSKPVSWPPTHGFNLDSLLLYAKRFEP